MLQPGRLDTVCVLLKQTEDITQFLLQHSIIVTQLVNSFYLIQLVFGDAKNGSNHIDFRVPSRSTKCMESFVRSTISEAQLDF